MRICGQPTSVAGIQVEDDAVGPRGRVGAREPGVDLDGAHLRERDEPLGRVDRQQLHGLALERVVERVDVLAQALVGVTLVEAVAAVADRAAHQRERPVGGLGEHERRDGRVVVREVGLGERRVGEEPLAGVGHAHAENIGRLGVGCGDARRVRVQPRPRRRWTRRSSGSAARLGDFADDLGGALSSRTPRKTGWRRWPSAVHSRKATSMTSDGSIQCSTCPVTWGSDVERRLGPFESVEPRAQGRRASRRRNRCRLGRRRPAGRRRRRRPSASRSLRASRRPR